MDSQSVTLFVVGTLLFASPEQLSNKCYTIAVDIWSLGCVLACMAKNSPNNPYYCDAILDVNHGLQLHLRVDELLPSLIDVNAPRRIAPGGTGACGGGGRRRVL